MYVFSQDFWEHLEFGFFYDLSLMYFKETKQKGFGEKYKARFTTKINKKPNKQRHFNIIFS